MKQPMHLANPLPWKFSEKETGSGPDLDGAFRDEAGRSDCHQQTRLSN